VELTAALDRATAGFAAVLARVGDDHWESPTPNPGWSVADLVNHVIGGNRRYAVLLSGAPTVQVEELRRGDHLGGDPRHEFQDSSVQMIAAFGQPDALAMTVHHRLGDRSGADLLVMRVMEHALHGWDLARAIGVDDAIEPDVTQAILAALATRPGLLASSGYPPASDPVDVEPQRRLLLLTGRNGG
jgi:uncharacterized protein (TIGR03086 family)